jgi:hypothetical protein
VDFLDDPEEMTPGERLDEIAAILAGGLVRLRKRGVEHAASPGTFTENPLDCFEPTMPLCDNGLTGRDPVPAEVGR